MTCQPPLFNFSVLLTIYIYNYILLNKVGILYNLSNKIYITHFLELIILVHAIDSGRQEYVRYQGKKIDSYVAGSIVY